MPNSRQTDIQTVQTMDDQKYICTWSAAYFVMDFKINTLISRCRKTWVGGGWRAQGGGVAVNLRPALDFQGNKLGDVGARAMSV